MVAFRTGYGHQVENELRLVESVKSSLEQNASDIASNPRLKKLAEKINAAIAEAASLSISIDESLNINR